MFRKFENKKDIVLHGVSQEKWRANVTPELFQNVQWELEPDLEMFMTAYMDKITPDFVNLSIGLRAPQLYEETAPLIISLTSDDKTFEQIKKQLNRSVEVIKVVDCTDIAVHMKELMFVRITNCSDRDVDEIFNISKTFHVSVIDCSPTMVLIESVQTENSNNDLIGLLEKCCANRIEIVHGDSVAIEALSITKR